MSAFVQNGATVIDYARAGLEQPPRTRIMVQRGPQGIRFIDPPLAGTPFTRRLLVRLAFQTVIILTVMPVFFMVWHFSRAGILIGVLGVAAYNGWFLFRYSRHAGRYPTVIDITPSAMAMTLPSGERIFLLIAEIADIHASRPRRQLGVRGRVSSLIISAWGRKFWLLRCRDYVEVRWLARQLRLCVGKAADHPGEPAPLAADTQEHWEPERVWSGPLPPMPQSGEAARCRTRRWRQILSREYNQLGCLAGIFMFASMLIGSIVTTQFVDALMICLEFGRDAYFKRGLRTIPHHGFFQLNNGQVIAGQYQALFFVTCLVGTVIWMSATLFVAIIAHRLAALVTRRRRGGKLEQRGRVSQPK